METRIRQAKPTYIHSDPELMTKAVIARLRELPKSSRVQPVKRRRLRTIGLIISTVAVMVFCLLGGGLVNPALANALSKLPLVGSLFDQAGDSGLKTASEQGMTAKVNASQTHNGVTFKISEMMYDGTRMSMVLTRETNDGKNRPLKEWSDATTSETIAMWKQGEEASKIEIRANGKKLNVITAFASDILRNNSSILTIMPFVAETNTTSFSLPDAFNLEVVIRDAMIGQYFKLSFPVKKTTSQSILLTSEESKTYNGFVMRIKKFEMTEATSQLEVNLSGKGKAELEELSDSLMYDIQNEQGEFADLMSGSSSAGAIPENYVNTAEFTPFPSIPKTVTIKPYLWKGKEKKYIPELSFTLHVNK